MIDKAHGQKGRKVRVELENITFPSHHNASIARMDVILVEQDLRINGLGIVRNKGEYYVMIPRVPWLDKEGNQELKPNGGRRYRCVIMFGRKEDYTEFCRATVAAARAKHPEWFQ